MQRRLRSSSFKGLFAHMEHAGGKKPASNHHHLHSLRATWTSSASFLRGSKPVIQLSAVTSCLLQTKQLLPQQQQFHSIWLLSFWMQLASQQHNVLQAASSPSQAWIFLLFLDTDINFFVFYTLFDNFNSDPTEIKLLHYLCRLGKMLQVCSQIFREFEPKLVGFRGSIELT